ncbi:phosphoglycerate mutase-like protein [Fomitiporia mediterranea MF3/22]|uniref:phosphoglycerate mutase-like protein n=1 Tax=Fomitiporia mediterranea (strain MF3/22) TaxID=694068 RepID=UPI0004408B0F|nr:phosphoglycerate mutase-like protein [Fomitiporia mediterranea MF3/22]EJD05488.1 phosphoglycerate mutase-like protein [Fomitiporia mediterranea MF3/22]
MVLDVDGYPVAPAELALAQVHVYLRHGERTPVRVRMAEPPASIPAHWTLCRTARQFHAAVATFGEAVLDAPRSSDRVDFLPAKRLVEQADGNVLDGECLLGELTDVGRQSTFNLGRSLRKLYVDKLGFLPDTMSDNTEGYFRSTNIPRTIESLQQVMHGLYPRAKLAHGITPELRVRNGVDENLIANSYTCKRLEHLLIGFAQAAAAAYNHTLEPLDEKLSKYIGGRPVRIDGQPRASGILDTIKASMANGIKVPPEFEDKEVLDLIERAVVTEWFSADKTEEVRRLGMGRLLDDLSHKMALKAAPASTAKTNKPRILVHSTHDTALAALLATFDVFDDKWPAFTASITFELFKKASVEQGQTSYLQTVLGTFSPFKTTKPTEHFVRMRYQNQTMILPFCAAKGKHLEGHPEFCSLAAFRERVREFVPADWEEACKLRPAS